MTRRAMYRKGFLAPWHELVPQVWLYALADAQRHTNVEVHHGVCVVDHQHMNGTGNEDNLPEFTHRFHRDISCGLNALLVRERYDAPGELFDGRATHCMRLLDAPSQAAHLVYEYNNCVAAGLVDRPEHMPGHVLNFDLWKKGYLDVERPEVYFSKDRPDVIRLRVTPPPLLLREFGGDIDTLVYQMNRLADHAGQALRAARKRPALGAKQVQRLHPWSEPRTSRERRGQPSPTFRIGTGDTTGAQANIDATTETRLFRHEHEQARLARRSGNNDALFPFGTYKMRVLHDAPIAELREGALVTRPGPTLSDVLAELQQQRDCEEETAPRLNTSLWQWKDKVRRAFTEEAEAICEHAAVDFDHRPAAVNGNGAASDTDSGSEADVESRNTVVTHRFTKRGQQPQADSGVKRVIVLRDRRRGRPPGRSTAHGADPPD